MRRAAMLSLLILAGCIPKPQPRALDVPDAVAVTTRAIPLNAEDPAQMEIGRLRYLGGLRIESRDPRLGGLSGLRYAQETLYGVTDAGDFVALHTIERADRLTAIEGVHIRRLADLDGRAINDKRHGDAEAIELTQDPGCRQSCAPSRAVIAFEDRNQLLSYALVDGMPAGPPTELGIASAWRRGLPRNGGMEAIAATSDAWLLLSEERRNTRGEADGLLDLGDGGDQPFGLPLADGFSPTDAAIVAGGDGVGVIVLQRRFSAADGAAARLSAFSIVAGDDGAAVIGDMQTLATLRPPLNIDNMEGLAVRQQGKRTFVYIVSDDNFSDRQRTLLLKFEVVR